MAGTPRDGTIYRYARHGPEFLTAESAVTGCSVDLRGVQSRFFAE